MDILSQTPWDIQFLYWEYLLPLTFIYSDPITLGFHPYVKVTTNFGTNSVFSQGWQKIQYNNLVKSWLPNTLA